MPESFHYMEIIIAKTTLDDVHSNLEMNVAGSKVLKNSMFGEQSATVIKSRQGESLLEYALDIM